MVLKHIIFSISAEYIRAIFFFVRFYDTAASEGVFVSLFGMTTNSRVWLCMCSKGHKAVNIHKLILCAQYLLRKKVILVQKNRYGSMCMEIENV